jgi:hypothetical protein
VNSSWPAEYNVPTGLWWEFTGSDVIAVGHAEFVNLEDIQIEIHYIIKSDKRRVFKVSLHHEDARVTSWYPGEEVPFMEVWAKTLEMLVS